MLKYAPTKSARRGLFIAAVVFFVGVSCTAEDSAAVASGESTGKIEFAVGARMRTFNVLDASCERAQRGGESYLNIVVPAAFKTKINGEIQRPNILTAQLPNSFHQTGAQDDGSHPSKIGFGPEETRYGASASALHVGYDGEVYSMIQIIAQSARNGADYQCRASRDGAQIELVCNDALVFPWRNPGVVPNGSFRARFRCVAASKE